MKSVSNSEERAEALADVARYADEQKQTPGYQEGSSASLAGRSQETRGADQRGNERARRPALPSELGAVTGQMAR